MAQCSGIYPDALKDIKDLDVLGELIIFAENVILMCGLRKDYQFFLDNKQELIAQYGGLYIVISNAKVTNAFANENDAYEYGVRTCGLGNFIMQLCTEEGVVSVYHSRVRVDHAAV